MNIINCSTSIGQLAKGVSKTPSIIQKNLKNNKKFKFRNLKLINKYNNAQSYIFNNNITDIGLIKNAYNNENISKFENTFLNGKIIYYNNCLNLNQNKLNINIGGDHSISLGSVSASIDKYKDDLFVIWFDAHADINSFEMSKTKNTHGTPLHYLTECNSYLYESWLHDNQLKTENLYYIGIRDLDDYEIKKINKKQIKNLNMNSYSQLIDEYDRLEHFKELKNIINGKKIHLSIDVDGLDPKYIPCTGTPVVNGIDMEYLLELINFFRKDLVNIDIVELNLDLGRQEEKETSLKNFLKILNNF